MCFVKVVFIVSSKNILGLNLNSFYLFRNHHWLALYALILVSWFFIFLLAQGTRLFDMGIESTFGEFWASICQPKSNLTDLPRFFLMWSLMSLGMMLPTVVPTLGTYDDLIKGKIGSRAGFYRLIMGFCFIWFLFSAICAALQIGLVRLSLINFDGVFQNSFISGVLLLFAAIYQFSSIKNACLSKCRSPMSFFLEYGSASKSYEFNLGLRIGLFCLGCCWALMLLAFVGGTMNLFFMAIAMLLMTFEKLPDIGRFVTKPIGIILFGISLVYFLIPFLGLT